MAKIVAITQDGDRYELQGSWKAVQKLYDTCREATPTNIATYRFVYLYDDNGIGLGAHMHLSKEQTLGVFRRIQDALKANHLPLYGVDDKEIAKLIGYTPEAMESVGNAFRAFHVTEKQGGCWVFE